ncbi:hypothetical protein CARUB_v10000731mg [Capsella rubella]|uniref:Cytochrome P450 n=1 Tax=Capsella rubella TaxID=81985 RepID=R0GR89_9BRAS|nr:hypothetical protein CARUB_v10000731mg [Capsella rubella]
MEMSLVDVHHTTNDAIWCIVIVGIVSVCYHVYGKEVVELWRMRRSLKTQGVDGPPPSLFNGNVSEMQRIQSEAKHCSGDNIISHDYSSSLFPHFAHWRKQYGRVYTYSTGLKQHLYINHPEMVKELSQTNTLNLGRITHITKRLNPILGNGIITSNGPHWAHQRRIIAHEFTHDKIKGMVGLMVESAMPMLNKWEDMVKRGGELGCDIRVDEDLKDVSADVIARACFGSSFSKGKAIFSMIRDLLTAITKQSVLFRFNGLADMVFGSKRKQGDVNIDALEMELESSIWETVKERETECEEPHKKDLMQLILEGAMRSCDGNLWDKSAYRRFVVDNCKSIYFAGHDSTAVSVSWCLMLLALNPSWQIRIRDEILSSCKNGIPDAESIHNLKTVTMVIQETMRLYPPAPIVGREASTNIRLGDLVVPKGVCIWTLIPALHRDPEIWGPDANDFKPESHTSHFGLGPRICLGKNFAMMEVKVLVSLIVSKFSFTLSPSYQHSPSHKLLVEPQHGVVIRIV